MTLYDNDFYENRHTKTVYAAETILSIVQSIIPDIRSAVDIGCGVGTWLYVTKQNGATNVCGVDGNWVNKEYLRIQEANFTEHDFSQNTDIHIGQTFDLAISLEVAEHLAASSAYDFVSLLTSLSDFVLFSAAVPKQAGIGHINLQWPSYWISLFERQGYIGLDVVRKRIWSDTQIAYWYRQNTLLFIKKDRIKDIKIDGPLSNHTPPETYLLYLEKLFADRSIKESWELLTIALRRRIRRMLGART